MLKQSREDISILKNLLNIFMKENCKTISQCVQIKTKAQMLQTIVDMWLDWLKYQYIGEFLKAKFKFLETGGKDQEISEAIFQSVNSPKKIYFF